MTLRFDNFSHLKKGLLNSIEFTDICTVDTENHSTAQHTGLAIPISINTGAKCKILQFTNSDLKV